MPLLPAVCGEKKVISLGSCWQRKLDVHCFIWFLLQRSSLVPAVFMLFDATVPSPNLGREIISSWCCFEGEGYLSRYHGILGWKSCGFADRCDYIVLCIFALLGCHLYATSLFPFGVTLFSYLCKFLNCLPHSVMPSQCYTMLTYCSDLHCFSLLIFKSELIVQWSTHL